jgi:hypothetical protein
MIYLLTVVGLTSGDNSTVHIYVQKHNETQYPERKIHSNNDKQGDQKSQCT